MRRILIAAVTIVFVVAMFGAALAGTAPGLRGYEGQPGNQGGHGGTSQGLRGYEGQPGNQGGH